MLYFLDDLSLIYENIKPEAFESGKRLRTNKGKGRRDNINQNAQENNWVNPMQDWSSVGAANSCINIHEETDRKDYQDLGDSIKNQVHFVLSAYYFC